MQITKENVNMLKPGMLALVSGRLVKFEKMGSKPHEVIFEPLKSTPLSGKEHYDLDWYEPMILIDSEEG
ncbi:MAG: hypothetical protein IJH76_03640 [Clostridia bacterium]|nr:hypothetical protein [Clostridia bacterium]